MRNIIILKPKTYNKVKIIECKIAPFYNGKFDPISPSFEIRKYPETKEWKVYKSKLSKEKYHVYDYEYIGNNNLQNCKKFVKQELEKILKKTDK